MSEELDQRILHMLEAADAAASPRELPTSSRVWSQMQFRLRHQPRRQAPTFHGNAALVAVYLLVFLMWSTGFDWFYPGIVLVVGIAAVAAVLLRLLVFRNFCS
jgi:hypothetical protein